MHRVVLSGALALLSGCALLQGSVGGIERPALTFQSAALSQVSPTGATVELRYALDNPYPVALPLSDVAYQVDLEGRPLVNGEAPRGIRVEPRGRAPLVFTAHVTFQDVLPALGGVLGKSTAHYRAQGHVTVDSPAGPVELTFADQGDVDLARAGAGLPGAR